MSTPVPAEQPAPHAPGPDTLDLIKETAWRYHARRNQIPYTDPDRTRPLVDQVVSDVYRMFMTEVFPQQQQGGTSQGPPDRLKLILGVVALLAATGVGIPSFEMLSDWDWSTGGLAGGAFLAGVLVSRLAVWGKR